MNYLIKVIIDIYIFINMKLNLSFSLFLIYLSCKGDHLFLLGQSIVNVSHENKKYNKYVLLVAITVSERCVREHVQ
jgi:hypothetical protein